LASGGADARSANQTFTATFEKYPLTINYAYFVYSPSASWKLSGGKMANPLWLLPAPNNEMLWDADINPDGLAVNWETSAMENLDVFANAGFFVGGEFLNASKPGLNVAVIQPGISYTLDRDAYLKAAVAYYTFNNAKNSALSNGSSVSGSNNTVSGGSLVYDYTPVVLTSELGLKNFLDMPYVGLMGEAVWNTAISKSNYGALAGILFGDKSLKRNGQWNVAASYRVLMADAWPDILPDSDAYSGNTGIRGIETVISYALNESTWLVLDYYNLDRLSDLNKEQLLQLDFNLRF
jgi:hypothetical protein